VARVVKTELGVLRSGLRSLLGAVQRRQRLRNYCLEPAKGIRALAVKPPRHARLSTLVRCPYRHICGKLLSSYIKPTLPEAFDGLLV
jgi:hypothetical protein